MGRAALLLPALLVLGAALHLKQHPGPVATPPANPEIAAPAPPSVSNVVTSVTVPPAPVSTNTLTPEQRQAAMDAETDRLQQWSANDDPASLSNILADLTSSEKEIQEAAIEAAKQFGSSNAIPALKAAAASNQDTGEQIALLEAADFLSLPSLSSSGPDTRTPEQIQADTQRSAERQARRQAQLQKQAARQNSQPSSDQNSQAGPDQ
jgi:hypothetical protein